MNDGSTSTHGCAPQQAALSQHPLPGRWRVEGINAYLIGIGGCGMSGLARMLSARGASVAGSDSVPSPVTDSLEAQGFVIDREQTAEALPQETELVIATAAIPADHPQLLEAERRGIEVLSYAEALGKSMTGRTGVAIAGTHGKSTTTAMLGATLVDAGLDPTVIVGASCAQLASGSLVSGPITDSGAPTGFRLGADQIASGALAGEPGVLLAEACEYNRSFHDLRPTIASISAVEADHLDIYGSLDEVVRAFRDFAQLLPAASEGGRLLIAHEGAHRRDLTAGVEASVETIGFSPEADWTVSYSVGSRRVTLTHKREPVATWTVRMPGVHNAMNSATACALAVMLGADPKTCGDSLGAFAGLDRRTQFLGEKQIHGGAVRVWDDYGHHPTEIDATLRALRDFDRPEDQGGRLICVFQPHQHSRTRFFLDEFASAFEQADIVIVPQIYFVRDSEQEKHRVSAGDLVDRLRSRGVRAMHLYPFEAIIEQLENVCAPNDTLVVMGAGPVWTVAAGYLKTGQAVEGAAGETRL